VNIDPLGRLILAANERVTVTVTKTRDIYLATFSPLTGGIVWNTIHMVTPLQEERTFQAPAAGTTCSFTIDFNLRPDATGAFDPADQYTVQIEGAVSGRTPRDPMNTITPPPPKNQGYTFVTP